MRDPEHSPIEVSPEQSEVYAVQMDNNLESAKNLDVDNAIFDPKEFLASFRAVVKDCRPSIGGNTKSSGKEFMSDINADGQHLADHQISQLQRILGPKKYLSKHEVGYRDSFLSSVNTLGSWSLKLDSRGYSNYLEDLKDPTKRDLVLCQLAREHRRSANVIAKAEAKSEPSSTIWQSTKPHIFETEEIAGHLSKYRKLGISVVKTILLRNLHDIDAKLEQTDSAIKNLAKDPRYKALGIQVIRSAVVDRADSEAFLDKVINGVDELSANTANEEVMSPSTMQKFVADSPKDFRRQTENYVKVFNRVQSNPAYKDLGKSMVRIALRRDIDNPEAVLDQMSATYDALCAEETFVDVPPNLKKRAAFTWVTQEKAFLALDRVLATYNNLTKTTKYTDFLGPNTLLQYVYNNQHNTKKSLDKLLRDFSKFMSVTKYAELGESAIKNALHISPKNPKRKLDQIIEVYEDAKSDPRYRLLPLSHKKIAATKYANSYKSYLDTQLKKWQEFINENHLDEKFAKHTMEELVGNNPRHAKRNLLTASQLFDQNIDQADLSGLNKHFLGYGCIYRPKDMTQYLEESRTKIADLVKSPVYVGFSAEMISAAVLQNPDTPERELNRLIAVAEEYFADEEFACLEARVIRKAVYMYGPEKAKQILLHLAMKKA